MRAVIAYYKPSLRHATAASECHSSGGFSGKAYRIFLPAESSTVVRTIPVTNYSAVGSHCASPLLEMRNNLQEENGPMGIIVFRWPWLALSSLRDNDNYFRQGFSRRLSVCLSVCLLATSLKNWSSDLQENFARVRGQSRTDLDLDLGIFEGLFNIPRRDIFPQFCSYLCDKLIESSWKM